MKIAAGDIVRIDDRPHVVLDVADALAPPSQWSPHRRANAKWVKVQQLGPDGLPVDGRVGSVTIPGGFHARRGADGDIVVRADTEGHYPTCSRCGDVWPCRHELDRQGAVRIAEAFTATLEHEAEHPYPCPWCARFKKVKAYQKRCKTSGGLKRHISACKSNPANWNLDTWVPLFDDALRIAGGYINHPVVHADMTEIAGNLSGAVRRTHTDNVRLAHAVHDAALNGTLPATRDELDI